VSGAGAGAPIIRLRDSRTYLVHETGAPEPGERFRVTRYRALVSGEVREVREVRDSCGHALASVRAMLPADNAEIVIAVGERSGAEVHRWGALATGLFAERRAQSRAAR